MARYTGPKDKISRRFGIPIFGPTKALEHKNYPPGMHGPKGSRRKQSDYSIALAEKQKLRYQYGILERQFRRYFKTALTRRGVTGQILLQLLGNALGQCCVSVGLREFAERCPADGLSRACSGQWSEGRCFIL